MDNLRVGSYYSAPARCHEKLRVVAQGESPFHRLRNRRISSILLDSFITLTYAAINGIGRKEQHLDQISL